MITLSLTRPFQMLDISNAGIPTPARYGMTNWNRHGSPAELAAGDHRMERRPNPFGFQDAPWLFLAGTQVGMAEGALLTCAAAFGDGTITLRERVYVLSLWQPWATLWAVGAKRIETRDWQTSYRGEVYIHATKAVPASDREWVSDFQRSDTVRQAFHRTRPALLETWGEMFPAGKVLGRTTLLDCRSTDVRSEWEVRGVRVPLPPGRHTPEFAFGDYSPGRWMWLTEGAQPLAVPIPASGRQRLWAWERDLAPITSPEAN